MMQKKILFICMGNICRSAAAEAVLKKIAQEQGIADRFLIDSAGIIGYHAGERADRRMTEAAWQRGYCITSISRQVTPEDFETFDYFIAMDDDNVQGLRTVARKAAGENIRKHNCYISKISKLTDYCTEDFLRSHSMPNEVPDPYYGGTSGFYLVLDILEDAGNGILRKLG